jgi:pilin isopeptide linkage protein
VTVTDNGDGKLSVQYNGSDTLTTPEWTNEYAAEGSGEVKVQKVLNGRAWTNDDKFTFTISAAEGTPMPANRSITIAKSDADQIKSFGVIEFTEAGTYTYTVKESKGSAGGVSYDETEHTVTIEVVDDGKGNLIAKDGSSLIQTVEITNTYRTSGNGEVKVQKVLDGREWKNTDVFTFELKPGTNTAGEGIETPMPSDRILSITKEDSDHTKSFGTITFAHAGSYNYIVKEIKGQIGGVIYDEDERLLTITVKDNGKGELIADGCELIQTVTITNTYNDVRFNKYNSDKEELEGASFALYEKGSDTAIVEWTTKKGAEEDISEYLLVGKSYVIKETAAPVGYYSAKDVEFTVGADGIIKGLDLDKDENGAYMIIDAKIDIKVEKVDDKKSALKGAVLAVKDENGKIVDQWTTDGTAHEVQGLKENSTYTLTEITAPSGYEKAADITFSTGNVAKAQVLKMVDKKTVVPDTSDHNRAPGWTAGMLMSMLVAAAAFLMRKKYGIN